MIPALNAAATIAPLIKALRSGFDSVWVVDDGSTDGTADTASTAGARVLAHGSNRGKGAALRTALHTARREGLDAIVTLDADGQHRADEAIRLDRTILDRDALVLGVRASFDARAPVSNQRGNRIARWWVHRVTGRPFLDSQCGLRRYPVQTTCELAPRGDGFAFESDVLLRFAWAGAPIVELPVQVEYPPERTSHFRVVVDPTRITFRIIASVLLHAVNA